MTPDLSPSYVWESMKSLQPSLYKWALLRGIKIREDLGWEELGLGMTNYYRVHYCGKCSKVYNDRTLLHRCCEGGYTLWLIPPIWMPDKLLVLTIELFDHVQTIT